jgi:hypothetical protein
MSFIAPKDSFVGLDGGIPVRLTWHCRTYKIGEPLIPIIRLATPPSTLSFEPTAVSVGSLFAFLLIRNPFVGAGRQPKMCRFGPVGGTEKDK